MPVKIRPIERKGYCRGCGRSLNVGDLILYARHYRDTVILCEDCVRSATEQMLGIVNPIVNNCSQKGVTNEM